MESVILWLHLTTYLFEHRNGIALNDQLESYNLLYPLVSWPPAEKQSSWETLQPTQEKHEQIMAALEYVSTALLQTWASPTHCEGKIQLQSNHILWPSANLCSQNARLKLAVIQP